MLKNRLIITCLTIVFFSTLSFAQKGGAKNNIYVDGGAMVIFPAGFYSSTLSYERKLWGNDQRITGYARTGIGYAGLESFERNDQILGMPAALTLLTGRGNKHFEMVLGAIIGSYKNHALVGRDVWNGEEYIYEEMKSNGRTFGGYPLIEMGYRFQKPQGGLVLV